MEEHWKYSDKVRVRVVPFTAVPHCYDSRMTSAVVTNWYIWAGSQQHFFLNSSSYALITLLKANGQNRTCVFKILSSQLKTPPETPFIGTSAQICTFFNAIIIGGEEPCWMEASCKKCLEIIGNPVRSFQMAWYHSSKWGKCIQEQPKYKASQREGCVGLLQWSNKQSYNAP